MEVGLAELKGRQEKGEVFGGRGGWPSGNSLSPEGPDDSSSPPPLPMLDLLIWLSLYFWRGVESRIGCFQQFGVGSCPLFKLP